MSAKSKFTSWTEAGKDGCARYRGEGYAEQLQACAALGLKTLKELDEAKAELAGAVEDDKGKGDKGKGGK